MNRTWDFNDCVSALEQEIALLQKISLVQDSVHQAVMTREWTDFDWKIAEINQLGEEFSRLESFRIEVFGALIEKLRFDGRLPNEEEPSFYTLAAKLPQDECRLLSGLFRDLKMATLKLKAQNETFKNYLNEIKTITAAWLEAIFPVQGGRLYTRKGRQAAGEMHSMVLNHRI